MTALPDWDFTLRKYERLCQALRGAGYTSMRMGDYLTRDPPSVPEAVVLLRHDVETRPRDSLRMAEVEARHELLATYFYRTRRISFDPEVVRRVAGLGHEIGYHYDVFSRARGDFERAFKLFRQELARLREIVPVRVASMHGSPLAAWDNRDLWQRAAPGDFGLVGEVYRDIDYRAVHYFSDTGRTWDPRRYNIRDHTGTDAACAVDSTDELIALVESRRLARLCLLVHPERWPSTLLGFGLQASLDALTNLAKLLLLRFHAAGR